MVNRRFFTALFSSLLLLSLASQGFNFVMNPYGIYPAAGQFIERQPVDLFWHVRLYKPYTLLKRNADHLMVGSSRTGRMVPAQTWPAPANSYNASLPGITGYEILRQVQHANAVRPIAALVLGLEYYMFRADKELFMPGFADDRMLRPQPDLGQQLRHSAQVFVDHWATLFSRSALKDSYRATVGQHESQRTFYADGSWDTDAGQYAGRFSYHLLSNQKYREFRSLSRQVDYQWLEELLRYCQQEGIAVTLLISPSHAHILNAIDLAGRFPNYLQWQRDLVAIAADYDMTIVGMENNRHLLLEPIAPDSVLFHDGVHYSRQTGIEISRCLPRRLAGLDCEGDLQLQILNTANLDSYLDGVSRLMRSYPDTNPADYQLLLRSLRKSRAELDDAGKRKQ